MTDGETEETMADKSSSNRVQVPPGCTRGDDKKTSKIGLVSRGIITILQDVDTNATTTLPRGKCRTRKQITTSALFLTEMPSRVRTAM